MFWLGDWWLWGERRYGESAAQAAPTGYAVGTLQEAARVADRIESPRRLGSLSWSHHQAVAALDVPEQDALLHRAAAEHLSVRDLRHEVQRAKVEHAGLDAGHSMQAMAAEELRALAATLATALERRAAAWVRWIAAGMPADELARMSGVEVADVLRALGEREHQHKPFYVQRAEYAERARLVEWLRDEAAVTYGRPDDPVVIRRNEIRTLVDLLEDTARLGNRDRRP
jgi:hypothetical protein